MNGRTLFLVLGVSLVRAPAEGDAQEAPLASPDLALVRGQDGGVSLRLDVPRGWSMYTPEPGRFGFPLSATWVGREGRERVVEAAWPEGELGAEDGGAARVYRGALRVPLEAIPADMGPAPQLLVRWAICRGDLCVPGSTLLDVP